MTKELLAALGFTLVLAIAVIGTWGTQADHPKPKPKAKPVVTVEEAEAMLAEPVIVERPVYIYREAPRDFLDTRELQHRWEMEQAHEWTPADYYYDTLRELSRPTPSIELEVEVNNETNVWAPQQPYVYPYGDPTEYLRQRDRMRR